MKYKRSNILIICLFAISLVGCEYNLDQEYFKNVEKPGETHQLELSLTNEADTIEILDRTELSFNFNTFGLRQLKGVITLNGSEKTLSSSEETFYINPGNYTAGFYTLKATFYTGSGSGSIADNIGAEGYAIEKTWVLLIDGRTAPTITPTKSISEDGFLQLTWPKCNQYNFISYEIKKNSRVVRVITDQNCTSFKDSTFVGGHARYSIDVKVVTQNKSSYGNEIYIDEKFPRIHSERIDLDKLRVYWDKSAYRCKYKLIYGKDGAGSTLFFYETSDTSCVVPVPPLGNQHYFYIYTTPIHLDFTFENSEFDYTTYINGTFFSRNLAEVGYNNLENIFYSNSEDVIYCYDIKTKSIKREFNLVEWTTRYSCATNSNKFAVLTNSSFYFFNDETLQNPIKYTLPVVGNINHFILTDNDYVAISTPSDYAQYSIQEGKVVARLTFTNNPTFNTYPRITTSQDANYVCVSSNQGLNLYKKTNNTFEEIYSDTRKYNSAYFNPLNPAELLLSFANNNSIEIRNIPDFSIKHSYTFSANYSIENIDTESGYLLLNNYSKVLIVDIQTGEIKLSENSATQNCKLFGNVIFSKSGYYLDVSNYLNK